MRIALALIVGAAIGFGGYLLGHGAQRTRVVHETRVVTAQPSGDCFAPPSQRDPNLNGLC